MKWRLSRTVEPRHDPISSFPFFPHAWFHGGPPSSGGLGSPHSDRLGEILPVFLDRDKSGPPERRYHKSREGSAVPCVKHPDNLSSWDRYCPGADRRRVISLHAGEHFKVEGLCLVKRMWRDNCDNNVVQSKQALKHARPARARIVRRGARLAPGRSWTKARLIAQAAVSS
jgi:hypothetical protein